MATTDTATTPYWQTSGRIPHRPALADDTETDVLIVGAGITGLTTAYFLAKAGARVLVVDRDRAASAETGHTSAHLTMVTDTRLGELANAFGRSQAQAVWDGGLAAVTTIDTLVRELRIDAGFAWVSGYLHAAGAGGEEATGLRHEAALAVALDFDAEYLESVPVVGRPGIRFPNQARIHPRKYLAGIASALEALGGRIHEQTEVHEFAEDPRRATANGCTIGFDDLVLATHNPIVGLGGLTAATLFQTKLALYTSYVVAGRVAHGTVPDALWWDTGDPYQYIRVEPHEDFDLVILGGEDHKTGQHEDTNACYRRLEGRLQTLVPGIEVRHRWSGQVIETPDGFPYIGPTAPHQFAATGYAGNGLTFGTLAGIVIADAILERPNPWSELFDPGRKALTRGFWEYVSENFDYPSHLVRGRLAGANAASLDAVKRGEGRIVEHNGAKVAAYRDHEGAITLVSATCTHMGCTVAWNTAEATWDCPCHGSRFTPSGEVISGPAETPLPVVE